jgi:stage V sporulation protein R
VKRQLLASLTNLGRPQIAVRDGNYRNRGELFLDHTYAGVELQLDYAKESLRNLHKLWNRPVHLETVLEDSRTMISFDGSELEIEKGEPIELAEGAHI